MRGQPRVSWAACCHTKAPEPCLAGLTCRLPWPWGLMDTISPGSTDAAILTRASQTNSRACWRDYAHDRVTSRFPGAEPDFHRGSHRSTEGEAGAEASAVLRPRLRVDSAKVCGSGWSKGESTFKRKGTNPPLDAEVDILQSTHFQNRSITSGHLCTQYTTVVY